MTPKPEPVRPTPIRPTPIWPTMIASHRGGSLEWPENSPTAFNQTARLPLEMVEFDIHPSADGVLAVIHDAMLERTTSGKGPVAAKSWAELQQVTLNGSNGERMLRLEELIEIFRGTDIVLRLETKPGPDLRRYPGIELAIARLLQEQKMLERTVVTSFFMGALNTFRAIAAPQNLIWLVNPLVLHSIGGIDEVCIKARREGLGEIGLHQQEIDATSLQICLAHGLRLGAWATHEDDAILRMLELGVTCFTTDRPTHALRLRQRFRERG